MSLGPHVIRPTSAALTWARRAKLVKVLDDTTALQAAPADALRIFRHYFGDQSLTASPASIADAIIDALAGYRHPNLYVEAPFNEAYQELGQGLEAYVALTAQVTALLHAAGLKVAGFCFGTGHPDLHAWTYLKAHGFAGVDAIALHEYWGSQGFTGWNALRYRKAHALLGAGHPPFVITECGRDTVEGGAGGWRVCGLTGQQAASEINAYGDETARDPYVLGVTPFTAGPTPGEPPKGWDPFDLDDISGLIRDEGGVAMPAPWSGTGAWIWYLSQCGSVEQAIADAKAAGLSWVALKYSDGADYGDGESANVFRNQFLQATPALKAAGLKVLAYCYVYGQDPAGEAAVVGTAAADGADGIVLDAEYEYVDHVAQATTFFAALHPLLPSGFPLAFAPDLRIIVGNNLAPWTAASVNLTSEPWPWGAFLANCQAIMPQFYWTDFQVSPQATFGLLAAFHAACVAQGWREDAVVNIFPSTSNAEDLATAFGLARSLGETGASVWRLDDLNAPNAVVLKSIDWETPVNQDELNAIGEQIFFKAAGVPFNPTAAETKAWLQAWRDGRYLGRPRGQEFDAGRFRLQEFEYGVTWAEKANWNNCGYDINKATATVAV